MNASWGILFCSLEEDIDAFRAKSIVLYLYLSPAVKADESLPEVLYRAALEITAEETTGTWDPVLTSRSFIA